MTSFHNRSCANSGLNCKAWVKRRGRALTVRQQSIENLLFLTIYLPLSKQRFTLNRFHQQGVDKNMFLKIKEFLFHVSLHVDCYLLWLRGKIVALNANWAFFPRAGKPHCVASNVVPKSAVFNDRSSRTWTNFAFKCIDAPANVWTFRNWSRISTYFSDQRFINHKSFFDFNVKCNVVGGMHSLQFLL